MRVSYIELLGQKHPLCFSLSAAEELSERFGGLGQMDTALGSGDLAQIARAVDSVLSVLMKAGRTYAKAMGMDIPPELPCRPSDLIDVTDNEAINQIFSALQSDTKREIEVDAKNTGATQGP